MNNLYNNITDKNNFYNKLTAPSILLVSLIYLLSVTLIPIANSIINTKNNTYVSAAKQYNALNKGLTTKTNSAVFNTINTATYINNGQMLARQIDNNNLQSYINDAKGSVLKLNSVDKSQNQTYSYDAYGKPIANATKANSVLNVLNSFQYNGERFDNNTNLQYLRARFYNPETKRFINQDTYDLLNKFGYVNGNPVMGIDPQGHNFSDWIKNNWAGVAVAATTAILAAATIAVVYLSSQDQIATISVSRTVTPKPEMRRASASSQNQQIETISVFRTVPPPEPEKCAMCQNSVNEISKTLDCKHKFCKICIGTELDAAIRDKGETCPICNPPPAVHYTIPDWVRPVVDDVDTNYLDRILAKKKHREYTVVVNQPC